ncbi:uncharacterized protein DSM5745_04595 [Aspergillus mulundensis]|uniref:Uncharacterized protein n=1 Tax=Aspergillus mulundensis TaxID=1810919 RepID=A0A3D8S444_9EURO|nr:hypothetical protein DSM5745_04595 [Aspergillus mulundensis]RDW81038.1 hypothetical protein DSM5745_04595 [Aspergillus mulundensis]
MSIPTSHLSSLAMVNSRRLNFTSLSSLQQLTEIRGATTAKKTAISRLTAGIQEPCGRAGHAVTDCDSGIESAFFEGVMEMAREEREKREGRTVPSGHAVRYRAQVIRTQKPVYVPQRGRVRGGSFYYRPDYRCYRLNGARDKHRKSSDDKGGGKQARRTATNSTNDTGITVSASATDAIHSPDISIRGGPDCVDPALVNWYANTAKQDADLGETDRLKK